MRRRLALFLAIVPILSLLLAGCESYQEVGGRPNPKRVGKIVSLSPSTTELVAANLYGISELVGRTASCNYPAGISSVPVVAEVKPSFERIAAAKPDLIIYDAGLYSQGDVEKLKQLNIELFEFKANTIDEYADTCLRLASRTGCESRMSDYIDRMYAEVSLNQGTKPENPPKVAIVLRNPDGSLMVAGTKSFLGDVLTKCGAAPVGPESTKFENANVESLIEMAPEVILTTDALGSQDGILKDPRLQSIPAVKKKYVAATTGDVLLRAGTRVRDLVERVGKLVREIADAERAAK